jgi:hypothetical protein
MFGDPPGFTITIQNAIIPIYTAASEVKRDNFIQPQEVNYPRLKAGACWVTDKGN